AHERDDECGGHQCSDHLAHTISLKAENSLAYTPSARILSMSAEESAAMKRTPMFALLAAVALGAVGAAQTTTAPPNTAPTIDQILSLERVGSPDISPDGQRVAYTVRETNWDENAYETQIWLADAATGAARQLTHAKKSSRSPAWSPDGSKIAFISDRSDKNQIYVISPSGGEAEALTSVEDGVNRFEWSPDGKQIAYTATEPKSAAIRDREKKYGEFQVVEHDYRMTQLFVLDVAAK